MSLLWGASVYHPMIVDLGRKEPSRTSVVLALNFVHPPWELQPRDCTQDAGGALKQRVQISRRKGLCLHWMGNDGVVVFFTGVRLDPRLRLMRLRNELPRSATSHPGATSGYLQLQVAKLWPSTPPGARSSCTTLGQHGIADHRGIHMTCYQDDSSASPW